MLELSAQVREKIGGGVKSLRKQGVLPAILYGYKTKDEKGMPLQVDYEQFEKVFREAGETGIIKIKIAKGDKVEEKEVLIYGIAKDPVTGVYMHVDLYEAKMDEPIEADVPLVFVGEPPAVRAMSGTLIKNFQEVKVKALPRNLPHHIEIDVGGLETFDDHICIKDLSVSREVEILAEPEEVVALVVPPRKEEEKVEAPEVVEGEAPEGVEEATGEETEEKEGGQAEE